MVKDDCSKGPSDKCGNSLSEFEKLKATGKAYGFNVEKYITPYGNQQIGVFFSNGYGVSMIDFLKSKPPYVNVVVCTGTCFTNMVICNPENWPGDIGVSYLEGSGLGIKYKDFCFLVRKPLGIKVICDLVLNFPKCEGPSASDVEFTDEAVHQAAKEREGDNDIPADLMIDPSTKTADELKAILDKYVPGITDKISNAIDEVKARKAKPKPVLHPYNQRFSNN